MLHGSHFFFDPHPAWELDFRTWWHLPSENAIFFIFSTPPQRESTKSMKSHLEAPSWTTRRGRREKQLGTKTSPSSLDYERDVFLKSTKYHRIQPELCVFLNDYNELQLRRLHARCRNFNQIYQNHSKLTGKYRKIASRSFAQIASTSWLANSQGQASNLQPTNRTRSKHNCQLGMCLQCSFPPMRKCTPMAGAPCPWSVLTT